MYHLVAEAQWSDDAMLPPVAREVLPQLMHGEGSVSWILDDTDFPKKGEHSVGVARQYPGQTGKPGNYRVAVTRSPATPEGSLPLDFRLYQTVARGLPTRRGAVRCAERNRRDSLAVGGFPVAVSCRGIRHGRSAASASASAPTGSSRPNRRGSPCAIRSASERL